MKKQLLFLLSLVSITSVVAMDRGRDSITNDYYFMEEVAVKSFEILFREKTGNKLDRNRRFCRRLAFFSQSRTDILHSAVESRRGRAYDAEEEEEMLARSAKDELVELNLCFDAIEDGRFGEDYLRHRLKKIKSTPVDLNGEIKDFRNLFHELDTIGDDLVKRFNDGVQ